MCGIKNFSDCSVLFWDGELSMKIVDLLFEEKLKNYVVYVEVFGSDCCLNFIRFVVFLECFLDLYIVQRI